MLVVLNILFEIVQPTAALALTEGPSQPEVQSFEPIGTTDMVDVFSGDFNYNIPLFNLPGPNGGYPVNLAYHAGVSMDDEASWVGLGWNINPGSLVRNMRGLPDEFKSTADGDNASASGDYLDIKSDMKQNMTVGSSFNSKVEAVGADFNASASVGMSVYYNNYRGLGISVDQGIKYGACDVQGGLGLSLDSDNGVGVNASVSLNSFHGNETRTRELSFSFDGNLSIEYSVSKTDYLKNEDGSLAKGSNGKYLMDSENYGSSITFARSAFSPSLAFKMTKWNASFGLYGGVAGTPLYYGFGGSVFFNTEDMSDEDKKGRKHLVMGYDNFGNPISSSQYSKDFSRERDGQITAFTPYLPSSNYTYDTYQSTGQGLSGYFRPKRNDVGRVHDPEMRNNTYGGSLSLEVGSGAGVKAGIQVNLNYGHNSQGAWDENNELNNEFGEPYVVSSSATSFDENLYYMAHGEAPILEASDIDYQFDLDMAKLKFAPKGTSGSGTTPYGGKRYLKDADYQNFLTGKKDTGKARAKRNTTISNLKNSDVVNLGEYQFKYYNWTSLNLAAEPTQTLNRSSRNGTNIGSHYAGFKVLNEEGANYVYGLPAYNNVDVENLYSTKGGIQNGTYITNVDIKDNEVDYKQYAKGHQFIKKVKKSPYAHSYLLTSVQGADYVDSDPTPGPSDDDLGYWVKFSYVKKTDNYKWRTPYDRSKAFFSQGASYTDEDDKASYTYGEKELWYLGRMETKTHVAIFKMSEREDMVEASAEIGTTTDTDLSNQRSGLRLDTIVVFDKKSFNAQGENARFLQKIVFEYDYKLCRKVSNSRTSQGKLALKSVYFLSNGSKRGALNKYEFAYVADAGGNIGTTYCNPDFKMGAYDSWGAYRPRIKDEFANNFPYVNQFNQDWNQTDAWEPGYTDDIEDKESKEITKTEQDALASSWSLSQIKLPSGGMINVKYESDDYGYVQHKTANQMFKIASLGDMGHPQRIYDDKDENFKTDLEKRRIYFKLEQPIPVRPDITEDVRSSIVFNDYVKPIHQELGERYLYFKTKMKLTSKVDDYVSGYLPLEDGPKLGNTNTYGVATSNFDGHTAISTVDGEQCYNYGFVTVKATSKIRNSAEKYTYHPMAIAGWTYLQTSAPELFQDQAGFSDDVNESNFGGKIGAFLNVLPEMISNWGGVKSYCAGKKFCSDINLDYSCIRLASPDKIKYGGGHRVKEISINDNWSASTGVTEPNRIYGQRYDYTIEENGKMISSGVAAYEPQAGGDENALKYPYFYAEKQNYFSKNNLFAEAPFNESLFPGPSVGYRKVTVTSINTDTQMKNAVGGSTPPVGRTGGITEHTFYTAKEFPTMVEASQLKEENSTLDSYNLLIPIPLVGSIKYNYYHGTQAYKIELNDMHGKPKGTRMYEVNEYTRNASPITETSYEYQCDPVSYMGEQVWKLNNEISVIKNDNTHLPSGTKKLKGVEVDLFTDQRESNSFNVSAGLAFNVDFPPMPFPIPSIWPSYSSNKQLFRTYVTNKVIHRSGILKKTISRDLQTSNESEVIAYDDVSGNPILVKTKNEFGEDFYSYSIPAFYPYDLMGHASRNIDYCFKTKLLKLPTETCYYTFEALNPVNRTNHLVRGDELLVNGVRTYFLGWTYNGTDQVLGMLHALSGSIPGNLTDASLRVIRSGRRNHYATMAGNYLIKDFPTLVGVPLTLEDGSSYLEPNPANPGSDQPAAKMFTKNVLSATATLFMDSWRDEITGNYQTLDFQVKDRRGEIVLDDRGNPVSLSGETFTGDDQVNPYLTGNAGIWRSYKSYTYVGKRKTSGLLDYRDYSLTDQDPKLNEDGVFENGVMLFDWNLGLPEYNTYGVNGSNPYKNWEWTNEITRFNTEAYETENVNRIGIHSSALYGYNNSLSIGVGGNASFHEMGVMDFETLSANVISFGQTMKENGLNFYNNMANAPKKLLVTEVQNFSHAIYTSATNLLEVTFKFRSGDEAAEFAAMVNADNYNMGNPTPGLEDYQQKSNKLENTFGITLISKTSNQKKGNQSFSLNGKCNGGYAIPGTNDVKCSFAPYVCTKNDAPKYLADNSYYYGKVTMLKKRLVLNLDNERSAVETTKFIANGVDGMKAHSGKRMMKVNGSLMFEQQKFCFAKNKTYVLSMWVSRQNQDVKTYQTSNLVQPIMIDQTTSNWYLMPSPALTSVKYTYGKIIEGWQKVDVEFTDDGTFKNSIFAIRFNTGGSPLYVDDVRLSPKTGGLKTFVYDPVTFWLKASLNVDNYATFYYYNEQGALTLTKQETEKGIFSVSESRSRLKK